MGLSWNVTDVKDHETVCFYRASEDDPMGQHKKGDRLIRSETEALIFLSMPCGFHKITTDNAVEVYGRCYGIERFGAFRTQRGKPVYITLADVRAHVGLTTNASPKTAGQYAAALARCATDHAKEEARAEASSPKDKK